MSGAVWRRVADELGHWLRASWTPADVGKHWDKTEEYDEINQETYSYFRRFTDALRLSEIPAGARVIDVCARTGQGALYFYRHGRIGSVVCMDVSQRMGEICKRRLADSGVKNFSWVQMSDYSLPFRTGEFDAVLCFETVEHFSEPERLVMELGRITKSDGTLILTTPNILWEPIHALAAITRLHHSEGPHRFIRYGRLVRMVKSAGFRIERAETTVLVPGGPPSVVRLGEWIEEHTKNTLMRLVGLRRVLIGRKMQSQSFERERELRLGSRNY